MKKLWWFSRFLVIAIALYCILSFGNGFTQQNTKADGGECDTSFTCHRSQVNNNCTCASIECDSCLSPSGSTNCGTCFKKPPEGD